MSPREHFHGVVAALQPVVHGVPDGALSRPTPCEGFDVRTLVSHLLGTTEAMRRIAAGESPDPQDPWGTGGVELTEDWRDELSRRMVALADAWVPTEAWEGDAMDGAMPRAVIGEMAYAEIVLHGWDLAVATDQGVELTEPQVAELVEIADKHGETGRSMGAFGPLVDVDEDAPPFDHALGETGRDPDWSA